MARLADTYELRCAYCHQEFIPAKRGTQRFCSGSCRTTYCKKKKAGTLGRVTKLKGPGQSGSPTSFAEMTLASAAGALAANTLTQGAEYHLVTKDLVEQVTQLRAQVQRLQASQAASEARHEANVALLGRGILTLLVQSGFTEAQARAAIETPFGRPTPAAESPERPAAAGEPLASALPPAAPGPAPRARKRPRAELVSVQTESADAELKVPL
jgi:hypothetical protein